MPLWRVVTPGEGQNENLYRAGAYRIGIPTLPLPARSHQPTKQTATHATPPCHGVAVGRGRAGRRLPDRASGAFFVFVRFCLTCSYNPYRVRCVRCEKFSKSGARRARNKHHKVSRAFCFRVFLLCLLPRAARACTLPFSSRLVSWIGAHSSAVMPGGPSMQSRAPKQLLRTANFSSYAEAVSRTTFTPDDVPLYTPKLDAAHNAIDQFLENSNGGSTYRREQHRMGSVAASRPQTDFYARVAGSPAIRTICEVHRRHQKCHHARSHCPVGVRPNADVCASTPACAGRLQCWPLHCYMACIKPNGPGPLVLLA